MIDEEKKAIEELEEFIEDDEIQNISVFTAKKIKNIIKKQQKEIEELKSKYKDLFFQNFDLWEKSIFPKQTIEKDYISKDKIREIIAEYQKQLQSADTERTAIMLSNFIMVLNDLLEEN